MSKDWTYGKAGNAFPVKPGETWAVGDHRFVCSNLMESDLYLRQLSAWPPDMLYCDPPWNQGNVNSFHTKAGIPHAEHSYLDLYRKIISIGSGIPTFIEGGLREEEQVGDLMKSSPLALFYARWEITYYRTQPCVLHYVGPRLPLPDLHGIDDDYTPEQAMKAVGTVIGARWSSDRLPVVADPCAGRGLTARTADKLGWISVTNELSQWRMSAAMYALARQSGKTPQRIAAA